MATIANRPLGYNFYANLYRMGDLVWLTMDTCVAQNVPYDLNNASLSETIPSGFRPNSAATFHGDVQGGANTTPIWRVQTDGSMTMFTRGTAVGAVRVGINAMWFTSDA